MIDDKAVLADDLIDVQEVIEAQVMLLNETYPICSTMVKFDDLPEPNEEGYPHPLTNTLKGRLLPEIPWWPDPAIVKWWHFQQQPDY